MCTNLIRQRIIQVFTKSKKLHLLQVQQAVELQQRNKSKMEAVYDLNRRWITPATDDKGFVQKKNEPKTKSAYKLMSYNILAQDLLLEHFFLYAECDTNALTWSKRMRNLQQEILKLDPDILCLQEMQYTHLQHLVKVIGRKKRLEYIYKKKTGTRTDGCAIIYNSDKFELVSQRIVEYFTEGHAILNRENIALCAKFRVKDDKDDATDDKHLVVATTHLLYNPKRSDVRTAQVRHLLSELDVFTQSETGERLPVLLTGDFNFQPGSSSYDALTAVVQRTPASDATDLAYRLQLKALDFGANSASTKQYNWVTVDFILHSIGGAQRNNIKIWRLYKLPTVEACTQVGAIPNCNLGSDHYSIGIIFSIM